MRKFFFIVIAYCSLPAANGQQNYWQQQVNYTLQVSLNDKLKTLDAFEKIEYTNHSPDTLTYIWFHVWPNAYKNDKTAFSDQLLGNGNNKFYFSDKEAKGYINRLDFKVNNITAQTTDHPEYIDVIKLLLPSPLPPGQTITITTPFHVKLPYNFSRSGYDGESFQVTQWYPKPAVYDKNGWHPMPYLDQGEFYSEFGNFDVSITIPSNYVVAATGELQNEEEKAWLRTRSSFNWTPVHKKVKTKGGSVKTITQEYPVTSPDIKILRYKQDKVHDFAWFADKRFIVNEDSCRLPSGKTITMFSYYTPAEKKTWQNALTYSKRAVQFYSGELGEYPYQTVSVVQGPQSFGGGMEYPTITIISPDDSPVSLESTIAHEVGHNWLYGILATNERDQPWMDEGINSYYELQYGKKNHIHNVSADRLFFETAVAEKKDQPIASTSSAFNERNYSLVAYYKTGEWVRYLQSLLGDEAFRKAMHDYFAQWQFRHPQREDFKRSLEESSGKNLDEAFSYLDKKGVLPTQVRTGNKVGFLLNPRFYADYSSKPSKNALLIGPVFGFNSYDKLMIGAVITNIKLPPSKLQYLLIPMYGTGSKKLTGLGFVNYSYYPTGLFRKIDIGLSASTFSMTEFKKEDGNKQYFDFQKLAPGARFTFKEKDPRSTMNRYIQWKTYLFNEQSYRIKYDSIFTPGDTTLKQVVQTQQEHHTLQQLQLVIENYRSLYPYRGELKIEQGKDFVRAAFTGKYFFNYAREGGLDVRLFAGKFFYTTSKTISKQSATDRYHLNLTGANGYEDYTYSDYFIGRNKFEGMASQQIMVRDGGFKFRTDLLGDKVGKTDDWLVAVNFSSTIPDNINPLSLLPFKIPLKVFADIGTQADGWERESNQDRFLFDAGIHIPILKETINIYIPLLYSRVFKDYKEFYLPKKNRLLRTISFSIDIANFNFRKIDRNFAF